MTEIGGSFAEKSSSLGEGNVTSPLNSGWVSKIIKLSEGR